MRHLLQHIEFLAAFLEVKAPKLSFDESHFDTSTQIGATDGDTIFVRKSASRADQLFTISHEMRHVWQIQKGVYSVLREGFTNAKDYNSLEREIDANAFAAIIMVNFFHIKPVFNGLDDDTKRKIWERADVIASEFL